MAKAKKEISEKISVDKTQIDTKKIEKEIEEKVKEKLLNDLSIKIDYEVKNKLDKMEKRIYKLKKSSLTKRNIIILFLLLIIFLETKLLYDNGILLSKDNTNISNIYKTEERIETKDKEWYIENYSYLLDNIKTNLSEENYLYLYQKDYQETTIDNKIRLNMAYQLITPNIDNNIIIVKEQDLKDSYTKIFGNLINYKAENFTDNCIQFIYNKNEEKYLAINTECSENKKEIIEKIIDIYEQESNIIIETTVGIYNQETKSLSNINGTTIKENYSYSDNIEELVNKLTTYKYTFQKIDDNYYLKEIDKLT